MDTLRRIVVIDDEPLSIRRMEIGLAGKPAIALVGTAGDGRRGLALIQRVEPDIVFLDIQMPHLNGLELLAKLAPEKRPAFVFITAHREFSLDAFELEAVDYLLKPFTAERLDEALARAMRRCDDRDLARRNAELQRKLEAAQAGRAPEPEPAAAAGRVSELWVSCHEGERRLRVDEIEWVGAERDYVRIHTATRNFLHRTPLKELLASLDPQAFLQVRRSAFVRMSAVVRAGRDPSGRLWVATSASEPIPVGRSHARAVRERLFGERGGGDADVDLSAGESGFGG
jgi:DNA-binding LytR/AlgR family response regulator